MVGAVGAMKQAQEKAGKVEFVRIEGVSKQFDDALAVDDVNLSINRGEIFALLGGSGSGKSTLLRMLAGFERPTKGRVFLDGQDITDLPPYQRPINMMFQSYALFPHMTVAQNIAFGLKQDRMSRADIEARVAEMLKLVQMTQYARRKPHQLSGGQRQRVALARSLAKSPKLLLLDEPMGALDKKLRSQMQLELVEIIERVGVTCVVVTHDQEEAMSLATRIGVMNDGKIVQIGEPHDIYEFPNSKFVAGFVGSVNMFEGIVTEDEDDHIRIDSSAEAGCDIYVSHGVDCAPDQILWYAIRPEKMSLSRERPEGDANITHGTVEDVAYLGDMSMYRIMLDSGKRVQVTKTNASRYDIEAISWDDKVFISWEADAGAVLTS